MSRYRASGCRARAPEGWWRWTRRHRGRRRSRTCPCSRAPWRTRPGRGIRGDAAPCVPSFLGGCERGQAPRRPDAASLDLQPLRGPRLSAIRGAIAGPGEAVRPAVVVADPPERRVGARHAELLLDVHFRPDAMAGSDVLQSRAALGRDQLPPIEDAHRTPVAAAFSKLLAHGGELPIAEQVIEIPLMGVVGRPDLRSLYRNRRSSTSDMMNPNAGQPPERTARSNQARACAVSPRTRYQLPTP